VQHSEPIGGVERSTPMKTNRRRVPVGSRLLRLVPVTALALAACGVGVLSGPQPASAQTCAPTGSGDWYGGTTSAVTPGTGTQFFGTFQFSASTAPDTVSADSISVENFVNQTLTSTQNGLTASGSVDCSGNVVLSISGGITFTGTMEPTGFGADGTYTVTSGANVVDSGTWNGLLTPPQLIDLDQTQGAVTGGDNIFIDGSSLAGVTEVDFGSTPVPFAGNDDGIQLTTPPAAQPGTVQVTAYTLGVASNSLSFTYYPVPVVTGVSPAHGPAVGGTTVTITGSGFVPDSDIFFEIPQSTLFGSSGPDTINATGTSMTVTSPPGTGVADIVVENPGFDNISAITAADKFSYVDPAVTSVLPNSGPLIGGITVSIHGSNFTGATSVTFSGLAPMSYKVVNSGLISAVTPADGPGTVDVVVTTPLGTSPIKATDQFTYVAPTITKISPTSGAVAGGTSVVITGVQLEGASQVLFGGTPAPGTLDEVSPTEVIATSPPGAVGTVDVQVNTTFNGISAPVAADRFTYQLAKPATVTPSSGTAVGGTAVAINGTNFAGVQQVLFGNIPAQSFTVVSTKKIIAVTPQQLVGRVPVRVVTSAGTGPSSAYFTAAALNCPTPVAGTWTGSFSYGPGNSGTFTAVLTFKKVTTGRWTMNGTFSDGPDNGTLAGSNSRVSCNSWILNLSLDGGLFTGVLAGTLDPSGASATIWTTSGLAGANQVNGSQLLSWSGST
jgi:hypothetical protein